MALSDNIITLYCIYYAALMQLKIYNLDCAILGKEIEILRVGKIIFCVQPDIQNQPVIYKNSLTRAVCF